MHEEATRGRAIDGRRPRPGGPSAFALLVLWTVLGACAEPPGRVSLEVTWSLQPVRPLWLWAHVRAEADGPDGIRYATAGPVEFRPGEPWSLALSGVPNGADRVVVIEARARRQPDDRILYVGVSDPFALRPGADVLARVDLVLDVPRVAANLDPIALRFADEPRAVVDADHIDRATVVFAADAADAAIIANDPTLTLGAQRVELGRDARVGCVGEAPRLCTLAPWALTAGVPERGDGLYSVFVQLVDAAGYSSAIRSASVHLDTVAPETTLPRPVLQAEGGRLAVDGVLAARSGVPVELAFTVTEPLGALPRIHVGPTVIIADALTPDGRTAHATLTDAVEGRFAVEAEVVDVAGNTARLSVGTLERDDTPPPGLDAVDADALRLEVAPSGGPGLEPGVALRICPVEGARDCPAQAPFAHGLRLDVHRARLDADGRPVCAAEPSGSVPATPGVHPLPCDCPVVCIAAVDPAGNRARPAPVPTARWHLRPGEGLPLGDRVEPMVHTVHRVFDGRMADGAAQDTRNGALARGDARTIAEGAARWQRAHPPPPAPAVQAAATAFHATRGEALWFGGRRREPPTDAIDITGRVSGRTVVADLGGGPEARWGSAMVFDPQRDEVVLFGGFDGTRRRGDVWRWDGAWRFAGEVGAGTPAPRVGHAMAWHGASRRVLLFGGDRSDLGEGLGADLWAWDGVGWQLLSDGRGEAPPGRTATALTVDPSSGSAVLFGGLGAGDALLGDTWLFDGAGWTPVQGPGPPPRADHALLAIDGALVLVGGREADGPAGSIWRFEGSGWSASGSPAGHPGEMQRPVYDAVARQIISPAPPGATLPWLDDGPGPRWHVRPPPPPSAPSARVEFAAGATPDGALLVGGLDLEAGLRSDTWRWDGWRWRPVAEGCDDGPCAGLTPRAGAAVVATDDGVMLFGGRDGRDLLGDVWWLTAQGWRPGRVEGVERPRARWGHALAPLEGGVLLFGGFSPAGGSRWSGGDWSATTWMFDGLGWRVLGAPIGPSARLVPGLIAQDGGVLLWGGLDAEAGPLADQWRFDGQRWQRQATDAGGPGPRGRLDSALVVDGRRAGATLIQGQGIIDARAWRWDGLRWRRQEAVGEAPRLANVDFAAFEARYSSPLRTMAAVEDPPTGDTLVIVGAPGGGRLATWRWDGGADTRPAQTVRIPLNHDAMAGATLAALGIEVRAGGDGVGGPGAQLRIWDGETWTLLADNDAPSARPGVLRIDLEGAVAEQRRFGPDGALLVAVMPTSDNGAAVGRVALDGLTVDAVWRRETP